MTSAASASLGPIREPVRSVEQRDPPRPSIIRRVIASIRSLFSRLPNPRAHRRVNIFKPRVIVDPRGPMTDPRVILRNNWVQPETSTLSSTSSSTGIETQSQDLLPSSLSLQATASDEEPPEFTEADILSLFSPSELYFNQDQIRFPVPRTSINEEVDEIFPEPLFTTSSYDIVTKEVEEEMVEEPPQPFSAEEIFSLHGYRKGREILFPT